MMYESVTSKLVFVLLFTSIMSTTVEQKRCFLPFKRMSTAVEFEPLELVGFTVDGGLDAFTVVGGLDAFRVDVGLEGFTVGSTHNCGPKSQHCIS